MKIFWLTIFLAPAICYAQLGIEVDPKDSAVVQVAPVEAGAVQASGSITGTVQPGAFQAPVTTTFNAPLAPINAPMKFDAPLTVAAGALPVHLELNNFPHGVELLHMDENAVPVTVNIKIDLGPVAAQIAALVKPAVDAEAEAKKVWGWRYWILAGLAALGIGAALWLHGRSRGHVATIKALTQTLTLLAVLLALPGCGWEAAATLMHPTPAHLATITAGATAAATITKSAVEGVSAIEELKAEFQGKTPKKPAAIPLPEK